MSYLHPPSDSPKPTFFGASRVIIEGLLRSQRKFLGIGCFLGRFLSFFGENAINFEFFPFVVEKSVIHDFILILGCRIHFSHQFLILGSFKGKKQAFLSNFTENVNIFTLFIYAQNICVIHGF